MRHPGSPSASSLARPSLDHQIRVAGETAGWECKNPDKDVWLLRQPDIPDPGWPIRGRHLTILIQRTGKALSKTQREYLQHCEDEFSLFVVAAADIPSLRLALAVDTSNEAAEAEFQLEPRILMLLGSRRKIGGRQGAEPRACSRRRGGPPRSSRSRCRFGR